MVAAQTTAKNKNFIFDSCSDSKIRFVSKLKKKKISTKLTKQIIFILVSWACVARTGSAEENKIELLRWTDPLADNACLIVRLTTHCREIYKFFWFIYNSINLCFICGFAEDALCAIVLLTARRPTHIWNQHIFEFSFRFLTKRYSHTHNSRKTTDRCFGENCVNTRNAKKKNEFKNKNNEIEDEDGIGDTQQYKVQQQKQIRKQRRRLRQRQRNAYRTEKKKKKTVKMNETESKSEYLTETGFSRRHTHTRPKHIEKCICELFYRRVPRYVG